MAQLWKSSIFLYEGPLVYRYFVICEQHPLGKPRRMSCSRSLIRMMNSCSTVAKRALRRWVDAVDRAHLDA